MTRTRLGRLAWSLAGSVVVWGLLRAQGFDPEPIRLALLLTVTLAGVWLVTDLLRTDSPAWEVYRVREEWPRGQDPDLSRLLRTIESHLSAELPDDNLRARLREATVRRLRRRHGLELSDPRAQELVGTDLVDVLTGPVRPVSYAELQDFVERMERL